MLRLPATGTRRQGEGELPLMHTTSFPGSCPGSSFKVLMLYSQACGVDFEVKTYLAKEKNNPDEKIEKK